MPNMMIEKIERWHLVLLGGCAVLMGVTGWLHVPSVLLGGGVMQLNFWLLKKIVRALIVPAALQEKRATWRAVVVVLGKVALSLVFLGGLFWRYPIEVWGFMVGVSLLLLTCMIVTLLEPMTSTPAEEHDA